MASPTHDPSHETTQSMDAADHLHEALVADAEAEKNFHIRQALQLLAAETASP